MKEHTFRIVFGPSVEVRVQAPDMGEAIRRARMVADAVVVLAEMEK
jgi:hypothetical protein